MSYLKGDEELAWELQNKLNANPRRSATRSSAIPSNIRGLSQKKDTPSALRTLRKSKKAPPRTTEYAEPKLSPHDSGFSEISSTDEDQALSDFAPPSSSSSDSLQESSVISPSSPEEDAEEDIAEPSSPEVSILMMPLTHRCHICVCSLVYSGTFNNLHILGCSPEGEKALPLLCHQYYRRGGRCQV